MPSQLILLFSLVIAMEVVGEVVVEIVGEIVVEIEEHTGEVMVEASLVRGKNLNLMGNQFAMPGIILNPAMEPQPQMGVKRKPERKGCIDAPGLTTTNFVGRTTGNENTNLSSCSTILLL